MDSYAEGDQVRSDQFDGTGTVEEVTEEQGVTSVHVRLPEGSGVVTVAGIAAYDPAELRPA